MVSQVLVYRFEARPPTDGYTSDTRDDKLGSMS
jgi:hypothetical protein